MQDYIPNILKQKAYQLTNMFTTKQEKEESKKIDNCTIAEIIVKMISLLDALNNNDALKQIFKNKIGSKTKDRHL